MLLVDKIKVVLFDLGDTLIYFNGDWDDVLHQSSKALWKCLSKYEIHVEPDQFLQDFIKRMQNYYGNRIETLVEYSTTNVLIDTLAYHGYRNISPEIIRKTLQKMYAVSQAHWKIEPDAWELLNWLKNNGYRMGLISNASDSDDVFALLKQHKLTDFFEQILISAELGIRKPHPSIFIPAIQHFSIVPEQALMVGDTLSMDIKGAKDVGMQTAWISRRSKPDQSSFKNYFQPSIEIQSLSELISILKI
ncbi:MAG: hypothetical protein CVU46_07330 [Chloroflexi bacterium HGW-Chloroflexi-8]|jgi:HAD superfamily hydrolase (TIGR01662 family)|nr:MAG: hypothetical protein CVU46_07330 [Chloroflexi bacterium HGW-Chloroflexi-8]